MLTRAWKQRMYNLRDHFQVVICLFFKFESMCKLFHKKMRQFKLVCGQGKHLAASLRMVSHRLILMLRQKKTRKWSILHMEKTDKWWSWILTDLASLLRRILCQWSCISFTNFVKLQQADVLSRWDSSDSTDNCSTAQFNWPPFTNWWIWQLDTYKTLYFHKNLCRF